MTPDEIYNPLDKDNLGFSVAEALLAGPVHSLPPKARFEGAGIYAIYYTGPFESYSIVAEANNDNKFSRPIYVGKAVPPGARKGRYGLNTNPGCELFNRLREHATSIDSSENLALTDFHCRYLLVDDIWIPLGESLLIDMFHPLWNKLIDGFGIHAPGKGRKLQRRSTWDVLHPGRPFATGLTESSRNLTEVISAIGPYLVANPPREAPKS